MEKEHKPKVCYVLPEYNPESDTHFAYLYKLLKSTSKELNFCLIIETSKGDVSDLKISRTEVINCSNYFKRLWHYLCLIWSARRQGYKDIYVHYSFIGAVAAILVTFVLKGRVFYWNCGMPWLYKSSFIRESLFRFILRNVILVTGTESMAELYTKRYKVKQTKILPNWIDVDEFQLKCVNKNVAKENLNLPKDKKIVLFIHRLSERKGANKIIPTAKKLDSDNYFFLVLGGGPLLEDLKQKIEGKNVRIEGRVPHKEITKYLSAADIFFMPSEEEGFPHVLLEAMSCGIPYVATDVGGVRDISPNVEQKFIISERTPANFASAIQNITEDPPDIEELKNHVRKYDFTSIKECFIDLFKDEQ